jgi:hypothetical protein
MKAFMQDASECLAALKVKPGKKAGILSRTATAWAQAIADNIDFSVENVSITYREFDLVIGSIQFEPNSSSASDALFSKTAKITRLLMRCSASGSDAKPLVEFPEIDDLTITKSSSCGGYTVRLCMGIIRAEAEPIALGLIISALSGLPSSSSFHAIFRFPHFSLHPAYILPPRF